MTRDAPDHAFASGEPRLRVGQGALWGRVRHASGMASARLWGGCAAPLGRRSRPHVLFPARRSPPPRSVAAPTSPDLRSSFCSSSTPFVLRRGIGDPASSSCPSTISPKRRSFAQWENPEKCVSPLISLGEKNIFAWSEVGDDRRSLARRAVERRKPIRLRRSPTSVATASSPSSGLRPSSVRLAYARTRARA